MATNRAGLDVDVRLHDGASKPLKHLQSNVIRFVGAISASIAAVKAVTFPVQSAIAYERALKDVQKTTGFTDAETEELGDSIQKMTERLSKSALELTSIAAIAGQLGLGEAGSKAVLDFTEDVAKASVALSLVEEDAAEAGATLKNIFNLDVEDVGRIFSTVNDLSNKTVASATSIIDIMQRVGNVARLTAPEVAAVAAYSKELGVPDEQAGTAFTKFFGNMLAEADDFASAMGMTTERWLREVDRDAIGAFRSITAEISKMESGTSEALTKSLFGSGRNFSIATKVINDAANGHKSLIKTLAVSKKAWAENTSISKEYATVTTATSEQVTVLRNVLQSLAIDAGEELLPILAQTVQEMQTFAKSPEFRSFAIDMGRDLDTLVTALVAAVKEIASWGIAWDHVIHAITLFAGLQVGKLLLSIVVGLGKSAARTAVLALGWTNAGKAAQAYVLSAQAAARANAGIKPIPVSPGPTTTAGVVGAGVIKATKERISLVRKEVAGVRSVTQARADATRVAMQGLGVQEQRSKAIRAATIADRKQVRASLKGNDAALAAQKVKWHQEDLHWRRTKYRYSVVPGQMQKEIKAINAQATAWGSLGTVARKAGVGLGALFKGLAGTLLGMGRGLLAFFGGVPGVILTGLFIFWEEIVDLLGFADAEAKAAELKATEAKRKAVDHIGDMRDAYMSAMQEVQNTTNQTTLAPIDLGQLVMSGAGDVTQTITQVTASLSALVSAYKTTGEQAQAYSTIVDEISARKEKLTKRAYTLQTAIVRQQAMADAGEGNTDKNLQNVRVLSVSLREVRREIENTDASMEQYQSSLTSVSQAHASTATKLEQVTKNFDSINSSTLQYFLKAKAALDDTELEVAKLTKSLREMERTQAAGGDSDGLAASITKAKDRLRELTQDVEVGGRTRKSVFRHWSDELALLKPQLRDMNIDASKITGEMARNVREATRGRASSIQEESALTQEIRARAPAIIKNAVATAKYREEVSRAGGAVQAFAKRAQSAFDNTYIEIRALSDSINDVRNTLDDISSTYIISIKANVDVQNIDTVAGAQAAKITAQYDKRVEGASEGRKRVLESLKQEALLRVRNAAAAKKTESTLQSKVKLEQELYRKVVEQTEEAKRLAQVQGRGQDALNAKDQAKEYLAQYRRVIEEISGLTTESQKKTYDAVAGSVIVKDVKLALSQQERDRFKAEYETLTKSVVDAIPEVTAAVNVNATDAASVYRKAAQDAAGAFNEAQQSVALLKQHFDGVAEVVATIAADMKTFAPGMETALAPVQKLATQGDVSLFTASKEDVTALFTEFNASIADSEGKMTEAFRVAIETLTSDDVTNTLTRNLHTAVSGADVPPLVVPVQVDEGSIATSVRKVSASLPPMTLVGLLDEDQVQASVTAMRELTKGITLIPTIGAGGGVDAEKNAKGGHIRGSGTGTSDSILSWLSNGEFVLKAASVRKYGLGFISRINSMSMSKADLPSFASGGAPWYNTARESGGSSTSRAALNLTLEGSTFALEGAPAEVDSLATHVKRMSLKFGRRR